MRTGVSKRGCGGTPNSPGCACYQRCFALKCSHHTQPSIRTSSLRLYVMPDPISDTSDGGCIRDHRNNNVASVQETVCLENEVFVILVPRSVIGVGIEDQLGVRHGLNEIKGIHRINNDIVVSADNQRRLLDVLQIRKALSGVRAPFADGGDLGWRNLVADRSIAVLSARKVAL